MESDRANSKFGARRHFNPFGGGLYGGNVLFSVGEDVYKVERTFDAKSESKDAVTVYKNGERFDGFGADGKIGEAIFGIDQESFERTIFLDRARHRDRLDGQHRREAQSLRGGKHRRREHGDGAQAPRREGEGIQKDAGGRQQPDRAGEGGAARPAQARSATPNRPGRDCPQSMRSSKNATRRSARRRQNLPRCRARR